MKAMQCKVLEMSVRHGEFGERIGRGKVVDFDRVVSKRDATLADENAGIAKRGTQVPITLGDLLQGREDCFEPVDAEPSAEHQAPTPLDVEDEDAQAEDQPHRG